MIKYTEKGGNLHTAIRQAGHWLREENGVWVSSDDVAVQAIIDGYDPVPTARAARWLAIQAERDARTSAGYMAGGYRFHSDEKSRIQQLGLVMMGANLPAGIQWKTFGSGFVTMTPQLAGAIFQATAAGDTAIFAAAETHRAQIEAMTDWQAITAYNYSTGWPEV